MEWNIFCRIVISIVGSIGGIGVIFVAIVKFSSNIIAERLSQKYDLKLSKTLEEHRAKLENGNYISRAMFDKEFEIYQLLCKSLLDAYNDLEVYHGIKQSPIKIIKDEELYLDNSDLSKIASEVRDGEALTERQVSNLHTETYRKFNVLRHQVRENGAFIPNQNQKLFIDFYNQCYSYLNSYSEEEYKKINYYLNKLQIELRNYLRGLTVV